MVARKPSVAIPAHPVPVSMGGKTVQTQVSVEDYEEVKKMWLNHYRDAPIPVSESVKTRQEWLASEEKKLTNINNLLASANPELKQKGLDQVAEILPFMLLGGFSEAEIFTYVKAKLEANRQIQDEVEAGEKAKKEVEEKMKEEESTLVEVPLGKEEAAKKALKKEQKLEVPEEVKNKENLDKRTG
jgi:hypothetical protein